MPSRAATSAARQTPKICARLSCTTGHCSRIFSRQRQLNRRYTMTEVPTELHEEEETLSTAEMASAGERSPRERDRDRETVGPPPAQATSPGTPGATPPMAAEAATPLFQEQESQALRSSWTTVQTAFVD